MRLAVFHTLLARPFTIAIMAASVAVLARFLTPAEFGVFAFVYAAYNILSEIGLFGLKPYLVRQDEVDERALAVAAGTSLIIGAVIFCVVLAAALFVPAGLTPQGFGPALLIFSATILFKPFGLPAEALLERSLRFGFISVLSVASGLANAVVAIALAINGWGIMALAFGFLAEEVVRIAGLLIFSPAGRVWPKPRPTRAAASFGSAYAFSTTLPKIAGFAVLGIIGNLIGLVAVGLYNRAEAIVSLVDRTIMSAIRPVILPILTEAGRAGMDRGTVYLNKISYLTALLWPFFAAMTVLTEPLILTLLGDQWTDAILPARVLLLGALAVPFTKMSLKLFVAFDMMASYLRIQSFYQVLRIALAATGALFGLVPAATGLAAAGAIKALLVTAKLHRKVEYSTGRFVLVLVRGGFVGLSAAAGAAVGPLLGGSSHVVILLIGMAGAGLATLTALVIIRHPLVSDAASLVAGKFPVPGRIMAMAGGNHQWRHR
jgi:O-antigen/teichoic acid export membrane protein